MQRQRKYRGYSETPGHPHGIVYGSGCYIDPGSKHYIISDEETGKPDFIKVRQIDDWTGLTDKNGKEIYEGDICEVNLGFSGSYTYEVKWNAEFARFDLATSTLSSDKSSWIAECEVIGNIYENPNLLTN